jgi:hypothetical protein
VNQVLLSKILKAIYAGAVSLLGSIATVLTGSATFGDITDGQWVSIALFALVAGGGVFGLAGWSGPKTAE